MTRSLKLFWLSVLGLFGLHAHAAFAADSLVLCDSTPSELKGESIVNGATNCVDVLSWSWGSSLAVSAPNGAGGFGVGRPLIGSFSLQKYVDTSSTTFFKFIVTASPLKGTLQFRAYGNCAETCSNPTPYLTVDMTKVYVTSQSMGGSGDRSTESISLTFDTVKLCYRPSDQQGNLGNALCQSYTVSTPTP
jgi:type VI secretion system secreted protein Hcp